MCTRLVCRSAKRSHETTNTSDPRVKQSVMRGQKVEVYMRRNRSTRAFPGVRESFAGIAAAALMLVLTASFDVAPLAQSTAKKTFQSLSSG
jgi:hypothetical protein